jgi:hypothetical protein
MKVTFTKRGARRYSVHVERELAPDLWCGSIGYDDWLPHDLLHFFAEAEYGLDGAVFGDLAAGGNARIFQPVDPALVAKMWRHERMRPTRFPEGRRRSENLAWELAQGWRAKTLAPELQEKLDSLAKRWNALPAGGSLTLEWPRPEGRRRHPPRERRRPSGRMKVRT